MPPYVEWFALAGIVAIILSPAPLVASIAGGRFPAKRDFEAAGSIALFGMLLLIAVAIASA